MREEKTSANAMQGRCCWTFRGILRESNFHSLRQNVQLKTIQHENLPISLPGLDVHGGPRFFADCGCVAGGVGSGPVKTAGLGDFHVVERDGQLMIVQRPGQCEPLHAGADNLLFVRSPNLEVRPIDADSGHTVVGSFSKSYTRVSGLW